MMQNLRGKILFSLGLAVLVVLALTLYADLPRLLENLGRFRWELVPPILLLTLGNYLLRGLKFDYYLRQIGVRGVSRPVSLLLFFSGLSMVITPGKVGEWLKCYFLRAIAGTPMARSAPIIIAERLTDGVACVLLALGGLIIFQVGWQVVVAASVLALLVVLLSQYRPLALWLFAQGERLPLIAARVHHLRAFYDSSQTLLTPRNLAVGVGLGFVSWAGECLAFYLVLVGLGQEGSWLLVFQAAFMLATSVLAGSVFLVPGGLGVAEGGLTGLAQLLLNMPASAAVAATLLIRACTLWFGVGVGVIALFLVTRRLGRPVVAALGTEPREPATVQPVE
jgi:uncharacterized protein (TIRG00374 family)